MSETDPKPFLSRWAERKAASQSGTAEPEATEQLDEAAASAAAEQAEEEAALSDEELCARYELPDPESCTEEDQLDGFFDGRVPDRLRQLAMRRMWRLNPLFRFADEMVEYGEDFTDAATVIPNMQTAYKVGKGYLDKLLAEEKQAEAEQSAEQLITEDLAQNDSPAEQGVPDESEATETIAEEHTQDGPEEDQKKDQQEDQQDGRQEDRHQEMPEAERLTLTASDQPSGQAETGSQAEPPLIRPKRMVFSKKSDANSV